MTLPTPYAALLRLCCHAATSDRSQPTARPPNLRRAGKLPSFSIMYRVVRHIPVSCRHSASRITLSVCCWGCLILFIKKCSRSLRFESIFYCLYFFSRNISFCSVILHQSASLVFSTSINFNQPSTVTPEGALRPYVSKSDKMTPEPELFASRCCLGLLATSSP